MKIGLEGFAYILVKNPQTTCYFIHTRKCTRISTLKNGNIIHKLFMYPLHIVIHFSFAK